MHRSNSLTVQRSLHNRGLPVERKDGNIFLDSFKMSPIITCSKKVVKITPLQLRTYRLSLFSGQKCRDPLNNEVGGGVISARQTLKEIDYLIRHSDGTTDNQINYLFLELKNKL